MFVLAFALSAIRTTLFLADKILALLFFFFLFDIFFCCLSFSPFLPVCPIGQAFLSDHFQVFPPEVSFVGFPHAPVIVPFPSCQFHCFPYGHPMVCDDFSYYFLGFFYNDLHFDVLLSFFFFLVLLCSYSIHHGACFVKYLNVLKSLRKRTKRAFRRSKS